jgi:hypothetical protein
VVVDGVVVSSPVFNSVLLCSDIIIMRRLYLYVIPNDDILMSKRPIKAVLELLNWERL